MICRPPAYAARFGRVASILLISALAGGAFGGTLQAPALKPGQYVYTLPEGFIPDKLSVQGLREIQAAASRLHYPFYVVFVRDLPTATGSSSDVDTEKAIVGLAEDWSRDPNFNRQRSTLYLVSYGPGDRKYKMLPAPLWRSQLGLEYDALKPYNEIFKSTARRDPQSALINTMRALDRDVYENFDPKRKAEKAAALRRQRAAQAAAELKRQAEERQREAQARLANARMRLSMSVNRLQTALSREREFTANPTAQTYQPQLERAQRSLLESDPAAMDSVATEIERAAGTVETFISEREEAIRAEEMRRAFTIGGSVLIAFLLLIGWAMRLRAIKQDRGKLAKRIEEWRNWIQQARQRYYLFDENRERTPHLRKFGGKTKELYDATSHEIDAIIIGVEAVARLLDTAEEGGKKATALHRAPLTDALASLDRPFSFETSEISDKLFEPVAKTIEVTPAAFLADLSARYDKAVANWKALNDSVTMSLELPDVLFPHTGLDALLAKAEAHGIPERWLTSHPLMGDDASDQTLYAKVNECRLEDPYAYAIQIDDLHRQEATLDSNLDRLIAALAMGQAHRIDTISGLEQTILHPEDDPQITVDSAHQELERLAPLLLTADSVDELEEQARLTDALFLKGASQIVAARDAIAQAATTLAKVNAAFQECTGLQRSTSARLQQTTREHRNVASVEKSYAAAGQFFEAGLRDLSRAQSKLAENRHLGALRDAREASVQFSRAAERLNVTLQGCDDLDAQKEQYMRQLAAMRSAQEDALRRIRRYNGSTYSIRDFQNPGYAQGPIDYAYMYGILLQQQREWDAAVRAAERAYEEAERRRREAEEAARRQRESWSSSSSSSHTSFSSSDSGSSGGSFGGGGSGSDGGSW